MAAHSRTALRGLYLILDPQFSRGRSLVEILNEAAAGGARLFQYRDKAASGRDAYRQGERLRCAANDVAGTLIVNDRCDVALAIEADGVHLGQEDLPLSLARTMMGSDKLIGVSTHTPDQVGKVAAGSADYLGFGPIFPTASKADHEPVVGIDGLQAIRARTRLPVFAIGGISEEHVGSVLQAGADGIAVMSAILLAPDIAAAVHRFIEKIARASPPTSGSSPSRRSS